MSKPHYYMMENSNVAKKRRHCENYFTSEKVIGKIMKQLEKTDIRFDSISKHLQDKQWDCNQLKEIAASTIKEVIRNQQERLDKQKESESGSDNDNHSIESSEDSCYTTFQKPQRKIDVQYICTFFNELRSNYVFDLGFWLLGGPCWCPW
jgi:hypothetical protein